VKLYSEFTGDGYICCVIDILLYSEFTGDGYICCVIDILLYSEFTGDGYICCVIDIWKGNFPKLYNHCKIKKKIFLVAIFHHDCTFKQRALNFDQITQQM
jgi:hypothetical protein